MIKESPIATATNQGIAILEALKAILARCEEAGVRLGYPGEGGERAFRGWLVSDLLAAVLGWATAKIVVGERFDVLLQDAEGFPIATIETKTPYHKASKKERQNFFNRPPRSLRRSIPTTCYSWNESAHTVTRGDRTQRPWNFLEPRAFLFARAEGAAWPAVNCASRLAGRVSARETNQRMLGQKESSPMAVETAALQEQNSKQRIHAERRVWPRLLSGQEVFCQPVSCFDGAEPEMAWAAKVRDVSPGGIGLLLGRRFEPGTALILEPASNADDSRRLLVRVVHATREPKGRRWIVGCTHARALSEEELRSFLPG